jgi:hypothetical protein
MKKFFVILLTLAMACGVVLPAYAAGQVTFDGDSQTFIYAPGSEYSPSDLFPNFKNVMPGDKLTETLRFYNAESNKVKVNVYIRSLGARAGSEEFLSQLHMTVSHSAQNTMSYMFDAAADATDGLTDWVFLGTLYSGGDVNLDLTLEVPITMGDEFQDAVGYIDWQFKVEAFPVDPNDPNAPQTGDDSLVLWCSAGAVAMTLILIPIVSRRRRGEAE